MNLEELTNLLRKSDHTEEEHSKILGQSCNSCLTVSTNDWTTLEMSGHINSTISSEPVDAEPSLDALIYAAQGILHPTLSFNHIPDLLDILSQVERAREFSIERAKAALIWQRFYETRPGADSKVRVLQTSDKDAIKKLLRPERLNATRRIFICVIEQVIRMVRVFFFTSVTLSLHDTSMCFTYGLMLKSHIVCTTISGYTFPGHMAGPKTKGCTMGR